MLGPAATEPRYWTAAVTKRGEEERAACHVEQQQFEFYLPRFSSMKRNRAGRYVEHRELLFPNYIMIKLHAGWRTLNSTRGIHRVFMRDSIPVRMRDEDIDTIRAREDADGLVQLAPRLSVGNRVMVGEAGGSYNGMRGVVIEETLRRVRVQFEQLILGRRVEGWFDDRVLAAA